jgi:hypothetical protein
MRNFRELKVWERSHRLVLDVYEATGKFPREETYGLAPAPPLLRLYSGQHSRGLRKERRRRAGPVHVIAMGSASELEYHLLLANDLDFLNAQDYQELSQRTQEVKRILSTFMNRLRHSKKLTS